MTASIASITSRVASTVVALAAVGLVHCSGTVISGGTSKDAGADGSARAPDGGTSKDAGEDGSVQAPDGGAPPGDAEPPEADASPCGTTTAGEVPPTHRAGPVTCSPLWNPYGPDAGVKSCTTAADCTPVFADDASLPRSTIYCLQGQCLYDECLTDSDCPGGQDCGCAGGWWASLNVCVPANCHVDSDCGPDGYCSPSPGSCGSTTGFHCHTKRDTCVDPAKDCARCVGGFGGASTCYYSPAAGYFVCGGLGGCSG